MKLYSTKISHPVSWLGGGYSFESLLSDAKSSDTCNGSEPNRQHSFCKPTRFRVRMFEFEIFLTCFSHESTDFSGTFCTEHPVLFSPLAALQPLEKSNKSETKQCNIVALLKQLLSQTDSSSLLQCNKPLHHFPTLKPVNIK